MIRFPSACGHAAGLRQRVAPRFWAHLEWPPSETHGKLETLVDLALGIRCSDMQPSFRWSSVSADVGYRAPQLAGELPHDPRITTGIALGIPVTVRYDDIG